MHIHVRVVVVVGGGDARAWACDLQIFSCVSAEKCLVNIMSSNESYFSNSNSGECGGWSKEVIGGGG
jgi:hypothetical protein